MIEEKDLPSYRVDAGCVVYNNCMWLHGGSMLDDDIGWYRISLPQSPAEKKALRTGGGGCPELSLRELCKQVINAERNRAQFPLRLLKETLHKELLDFIVLQ
jgi:hypothetical protein